MNSEYGAGYTSVHRGWYLRWQTNELRRHHSLSGNVYTELYDVEHETCGLYTFDRQPKDLGNIEPRWVNSETIIVLDVLPKEPGLDVETTHGELALRVLISHHGPHAVTGQLAMGWGPYMGPSPSPDRLWNLRHSG